MPHLRSSIWLAAVALTPLAPATASAEPEEAKQRFTPEEAWAYHCAENLGQHDAFDGGADERKRFWRWANKSSSMWSICVDALHDEVAVSPSTRNEWIRPLPHQRLQFVIRSDAGERVEIDRHGNAGAYVPGVGVVDIDTQASDEDALKRIGAAPDGAEAAAGGVAYRLLVKETYHPGPLGIGVSVDGVEPDALVDVVEDLVDALDALEEALDDAGETLAEAATAARGATPPDTATADALDALAKQADDQGSEARAQSKRVGKLLRALDQLPAVTDAWARPLVGRIHDLNADLTEVSDKLDDSDAGVVKAALADDGVTKDLAAVDALADDLAVPTGPATDALELEVERTYTGAIRPGVAVLSPSISSATWMAGAHPLGPEDEDVVLVTDKGPFNVEFVLGYSQYMHRRPITKTGTRLALNFGVGLLDLEDGEVSALRSMHLGPDWGWPNLSVALRDQGRPSLHAGWHGWVYRRRHALVRPRRVITSGRSD